MLDSTVAIDSAVALADSAAGRAAHAPRSGGLALIAAGIAIGVLLAVFSVVTQQLYRRRLASLGVAALKSRGAERNNGER